MYGRELCNSRACFTVGYSNASTQHPSPPHLTGPKNAISEISRCYLLVGRYHGLAAAPGNGPLALGGRDEESGADLGDTDLDRGPRPGPLRSRTHLAMGTSSKWERAVNANIQ